MEIILVRHGTRAGHDSEHLGDRGLHQAASLARALRIRGSTPDTLLSSASVHARETAECLGRSSWSPLTPVTLGALTPRGGPGTFDDVAEQSEKEGVDLAARSCVVLVGHEGRLSDLVIELTGSRARPVPHGGAVSIQGDSLTDLRSGRGHIHYRYPTVDHLEDVLRAKVTSKMTVATFLAGFVFTALSAVLLLPGPAWPWHRVAAAVSLTGALSLFVSAVYIYDQLGTPVGFWTDGDRPRLFWRLLYKRQERQREERWERAMEAAAGDAEHKARAADDDQDIHRRDKDGPVYWLMVRTSRLVFTPAVVLALAGFVFLLLGTGDWRIWAGGVAALVAGGSYAALHRPDLGAD